MRSRGLVVISFCALAACRTAPDAASAHSDAGTHCGALVGTGSEPQLPNFEPAAPVALPDVAGLSMAVGDVDGDRQLDVLVTSLNSSNVTIVRSPLTNPSITQMAVTPAQTSIVAGDFNGDGLADFAIADGEASTTQIVLSSAAGFGAPQLFSVGRNPFQIVSADIDGDGKLDLATANQGDNSVSILLGDGAGSFLGQKVVSVGAMPDGLAAFRNGDTATTSNLVVANFGASNLSIIRKQSGGGFAVSDVPAGNHDLVSVAVGDFNSDGLADLAVVSSEANSLIVLFACVDGTFSSAAQIALRAIPTRIWSADLNNDHQPDLVVSSPSEDVIELFLSRGDGTFLSAMPTVGAQTGVAVADFDGDGTMDLAVSDLHTLSIFTNHQ